MRKLFLMSLFLLPQIAPAASSGKTDKSGIYPLQKIDLPSDFPPVVSGVPGPDIFRNFLRWHQSIFDSLEHSGSEKIDLKSIESETISVDISGGELFDVTFSLPAGEDAPGRHLQFGVISGQQIDVIDQMLQQYSKKEVRLKNICHYHAFLMGRLMENIGLTPVIVKISLDSDKSLKGWKYHVANLVLFHDIHTGTTKPLIFDPEAASAIQQKQTCFDFRDWITKVSREETTDAVKIQLNDLQDFATLQSTFWNADFSSLLDYKTFYEYEALINMYSRASAPPIHLAFLSGGGFLSVDEDDSFDEELEAAKKAILAGEIEILDPFRK